MLPPTLKLLQDATFSELDDILDLKSVCVYEFVYLYTFY